MEFARDGQGAHAVEPRHAEVREDDLRRELGELLAELGFRVDAMPGAIQARSLQCAQHQLGVMGLVFDQQDPHRTGSGSCITIREPRFVADQRSTIKETSTRGNCQPLQAT